LGPPAVHSDLPSKGKKEKRVLEKSQKARKRRGQGGVWGGLEGEDIKKFGKEVLPKRPIHFGNRREPTHTLLARVLCNVI